MLIAPSILNPLWSWIIDNLVKAEKMVTTDPRYPIPIDGQDPKWGHGHAAHDDVKGYSYGAAETLEH
jgi:hypothetical protein